MIKDNHRIIIVFGMARSGTTAFTHVLGQHHKIHVFHNVYNYENDLIFNKKSEEMEEIVVNQWPNKRVLFKRPWSESLVDFYMEHMPDAYYIAMIKPFDTINESWKKSVWTRTLWKDTDEERRAKYDHHRELLESYRGVKLKIVDYPKFALEPDRTMKEVCEFLGLLNYRQLADKFKPIFDTSMIRLGGNWDFMKK
tara:strand:- start:700 stop:1287 length:588 start_codon:yes stop_codon:yes gene_type:complete